MDFKSHLIDHISYDWNIQDILNMLESSSNFPAYSEDIESHSFYINAFIRDSSYFRWKTTIKNVSSFCAIYTISGNCELKYDELDYLLIPNSIAFIDCSKEFTINRPKNQIWNAKLLFFGGLSATYYFNRFYEKRICAFPLNQTSALPSLFQSIEAVLQVPWDENYSEFTLTKLVADILMSILIEKDSDPFTKQIYPNHIISALQYIEANFQTMFSLDDIANELSVSKSTLTHDFSTYVGHPIIDYVIRKRISYAKKQLVETNSSITNIGNDSGFGSDSHFIQTFKKHTGLTPLQFRKKHNHYLFPHTIT